MAEWKKRFITGGIGIPLILLMIQFKATTLLLLHVAVYLTQKEYNFLIKSILINNFSESERGYIDHMAHSLLIMIPTHLFFLAVWQFKEDYIIHILYYATILLFCLIRIIDFLSEISLNSRKENSAENSGSLERKLYNLTFLQLCADVFGFSLFSYPFSFQVLLLKYENGIGFIILWFFASWQSDNGALFIGSLMGKRPFCHVISPKKTWEGVIGAIVFSVSTTMILSLYNDRGFKYVPALPRIHYFVISLFISVLSVFGDFIESFLKRAALIKDSGSLFPGHGGILDRVDSLSVSSPVIYFYLMAFLNPSDYLK